MSEKISGTLKIVGVRYYKNNWGIIECAPVKNKNGEPVLSSRGTFILKGNMVQPKVENEYDFVAVKVEDPKYGLQYEIIRFGVFEDPLSGTKETKEKFLKAIFSPTIVSEMYKVLPDPFKVLYEKNATELLKVWGCGPAKCAMWIDRFHNNLSLNTLITELADWDITQVMLEKICGYFKSSEIALDVIKNRPYELTKIPGIGFAKADEIAMSSNKFTEHHPARVSAYVHYILDSQGQLGNSYVDSNFVMTKIIEYFGEDISDLEVADAMNYESLKSELWYTEDKQFIGLTRYYDLEKHMADNVVELLNNNNPIKIENWQEKIKEQELEQGWEFTERQYKAIETLIDKNFVVVTGGAGVGKTSIAGAIIKLMKDKSIALCALSGKAALRLEELAQLQGQTIHRLLGINEEGGLAHDKENPLPYDLIVVDEVSMIGGALFDKLLDAIAPSTKVLMLGDTGQLEAIGSCNVASDLITSGRVPVVTLDKIHRQAAKSGIITESVSVRKGTQIVPKDYVGVKVVGELQDLYLDCFSDKTNTVPKILETFKQELENHKGDISKVQILLANKSRSLASTSNINKLIQDMVNPSQNEDEECTARSMNTGYFVTYRVGDRVINCKNNYKATLYNHEDDVEKRTSVFNGNIGIIKEINKSEEYVVVNFERIGMLKFSFSQMANLDLAYAVTVHKYQGSQVEDVIFGLDFTAYTMLSRQLVYTAMTRATKECHIIAQSSALRYAISTDKISTKMTHLARLINEAYEPKKEAQIIF